MTLVELKQQVMFQTGNDAQDLGDFQPHLTDYLNEGYDRLVRAYADAHLNDESGAYPALLHDRSMPGLPEWAHRAIADYATWMVYRNGSAVRQNRGYVFRKAFDDVENRLRASRAGRYIVNIPM